MQFNTQMVTMRKTVKRAKVQLIHRLTRQIAVIRKKKGSGTQVVKNERRAGRLVKEIEVIKDLPCDEVTMSAIINKEPLEAILNRAYSTAAERGTARLINQKLISQQVATFRDLVTDDLLEIGKKKEKVFDRMGGEKTTKGSRKEKSGFQTRTSDGESDDTDNDDDEESSSSDEQELDSKASKIKSESRSLTLSEQTQQLRERMRDRHEKKSGFFMKGGESDEGSKSEESEDEDSDYEDDDDEEKEDGDEGIEDLDDDMDEMGENFNAEFRELSAQLKRDQGNSSGSGGGMQVEKERKKPKGLDSLFVGKLSGMGSTDSGAGSGKGKKNRPGQIERQRMSIKKQLELLRRPTSQDKSPQGRRRLAAVDLPSLDQTSSNVAGERQPGKKLIPGINVPYEKQPKTDEQSRKALPSQRPLVYALPRRGKGGRGGGRGGGSGRGEGREGRTDKPGGEQSDEALHPSWIAKKKKKEQESKILPFTGKKIIFDD